MGLYILPSVSDRALFKYDDLTFTELAGVGSSTTQYAVASPPDDLNTVFLATSGSAPFYTRLRRSHTAGTSWEPVSDLMFSEQVVDAVALQLAAPSSSVIFCWNGDNFSSLPGIHRSTDGGVTWSQIVTATLGGPRGGWMAVAASKLFYSQQPVASPSVGGARWGELAIWRANLDGSAQTRIATILLGPHGQAGGPFYTVGKVLLRALSDTSVLVCARHGSSILGTSLVPPGNITLISTTSVAIGSPVTITPETLGDHCVFSLRVHFDSSTLSNGRYRLEYEYQNDDSTWSSRQLLGSGILAPAAGDDWWTKNLTVPCGARAVRFFIARTSATNYTLNGFRIDEAFDAGLLRRVDADGTVTDLRPPTMRRPWDVLPLTATRWIAAGALPEDPSISQPITVVRTDDAGGSWSTLQTIPVEQGFNADNTYGVQDNSTLLATRTPGSVTHLGMMGTASTTQQQIIWTSDDAGTTWIDRLNTADTSTGLSRAGFLITGPVPAVPAVAIPSRLATIVG